MAKPRVPLRSTRGFMPSPSTTVKTKIPNPESQIPNPKSQIPNPKSQSQSKIQNKKRREQRFPPTGGYRNWESDQKARVLVSLGERDESPCDVVVADQVENHFVDRAFAAIHFAYLLLVFDRLPRAFPPDNAKLEPILYQLSI